jgi:Tfp pilus assembly protein PilX
MNLRAAHQPRKRGTPHARRQQDGSVLMITLLTAVIIGISLAGYLSLIEAQNNSVARSQTWNSAIPAAEAGIEEALSHLSVVGTNSRAANGWTQSGSEYVMARNIGDARFETAISSSLNNPTITSTGYVKVPFKVTELTRVVQVTTTNLPMFIRGLVAKGNVTLVGANVVVDSFDSGGSTNWSASIRKDNGDIASNDGNVSVGNVSVYGHVATGPTGTASTGPNGKVGTISHVDGLLTSGIEDGHYSNDMNVSFPNVVIPSALQSGTPLSSTTTDITADGDYVMTGISGSLNIRSNTTVRLLVNGTIKLAGNDEITLEPGATLTLYMNGSSASFGGRSTANGTTNSNAINFMYYGTTNNTSLSISGNGEFKGMVYAPQADLSMNGSGVNTVDFSGAAIVNTATMNGNFNFHYDENLGKNGPRTTYVVDDWNEL